MSDDGPDNVPAKGKIPTKEEEAAAAEEEDGEEYRVEKVIKHRFDGGEVEYQIKWLGYDKKEDLTWEPIENLCVITLINTRTAHPADVPRAATTPRTSSTNTTTRLAAFPQHRQQKARKASAQLQRPSTLLR